MIISQFIINLVIENSEICDKYSMINTVYYYIFKNFDLEEQYDQVLI